MLSSFLFNLRERKLRLCVKAILVTGDKPGVSVPEAAGSSGPVWLQKCDDFYYGGLGLRHNGQRSGRITGEHRV